MAIDLSQATGSQLRVTPTPAPGSTGQYLWCHVVGRGVLLASSGEKSEKSFSILQCVGTEPHSSRSQLSSSPLLKHPNPASGPCRPPLEQPRGRLSAGGWGG